MDNRRRGDAEQEAQSSWWHFLVRVGQMRPIAAMAISAFWTLLGGVITLVVMRVFLVDQIKAEAITRSVVDSGLTVQYHQNAAAINEVRMTLDTVRVNNDTERRAICLDHTRGEQARIGIACPTYLYKGAQ